MLKTKSVENGEQIAIGMGMIRSFLSNYRNLRELFLDRSGTIQRGICWGTLRNV